MLFAELRHTPFLLDIKKRILTEIGNLKDPKEINSSNKNRDKLSETFISENISNHILSNDTNIVIALLRPLEIIIRGIMVHFLKSSETTSSALKWLKS